MSFYENFDNAPASPRQRDFVLNMNEFAHILNKTDGSIKCAVGPFQTSLSQQEIPVIFNVKTKRFEECSDYDKAKQLFVSAPEGWYVVLKNPTLDGQFPQSGRPNQVPSNIEIGKKINIFGPTSFALYPGQMAKVVQGHRLRSNQYLLARVYDADAAKKGMESATVIDAEGKDIEVKSNEYFVGQLLVIKGTEISFYIPPTGIEVIPISGKSNEYVRDAVTLERLEYAILKDEDGEKRYIHGPSVVFPKPTETFVKAPKGGNIFRALELSPISGIYIKVIAAYDEEVNGEKIHHPIGEELFITGKDQMIYYPRPEHAMIEYDGKYMHHAIAIPEGEGRYILNRLTGEIKTVKGPNMYLPDPRTEVVVKRKLSEKECELFYPDNDDVLTYNKNLTEKAIEKKSRKGISTDELLNAAYSTSNQEATLAIFEANANISRGVSYTKPRTITLDTRYEGVVAINVWGGYAIKVFSKKGNSETIVGPAIRLLDYDETLEIIKDNTIETVYLPINNKVVIDRFSAQTSDNVNLNLMLSYTIHFDTNKKDSWFSIYNYQEDVRKKARIAIRNSLQDWTAQEVYDGITDIVISAIGSEQVIFTNGIVIDNVEICNMAFEGSIGKMLAENKEQLIKIQLDAKRAKEELENSIDISNCRIEQKELEHNEYLEELERKREIEMKRLETDKMIAEEEQAIQKTQRQAQVDLQEAINFCHNEQLKRTAAENDSHYEAIKKEVALEKEKSEAYANTVKEIFESISSDLIAALTSKANSDLLETISKAMSPYAIVKNESVADVTNELLRGTPLEGVLTNLINAKSQFLIDSKPQD